MTTHTDRILTAFSAALNEHERVAGLEEGHPAETRLWHLLLSAMEFCDAHEPPIDFDLVVEEVRDHFAQEAASVTKP